MNNYMILPYEMLPQKETIKTIRYDIWKNCEKLPQLCGLGLRHLLFIRNKNDTHIEVDITSNMTQPGIDWLGCRI